MSLEYKSSSLLHNGKPISLVDFEKLCQQAINDKLKSVFVQSYFSVLQIVSESELEYDSIKLLIKLIPNLLKVSAKELILMVVNKPPKLGKIESKLENAASQSFMRSFKAYKEFIFTLLSHDCSYLIEIINFILNESLKLCTISASDKISLKIGSELTFDSIEEIQKKARTILQSSSTNEITLITDHRDEDFITELIKTHPNAKEKGIIGNDINIKVYKGRSQQNTLCFFYSVSDNLGDAKPALTLEK